MKMMGKRRIRPLVKPEKTSHPVVYPLLYFSTAKRKRDLLNLRQVFHPGERVVLHSVTDSLPIKLQTNRIMSVEIELCVEGKIRT